MESVLTQAATPAPKVSVCVITYNHARYLAICLQSILDQETDFPFEIIVGDDFSTDGTQDILRDFAARYPDVIRPIFQPVNTGITNNYLDVHMAAKGTYVAHCDGDDCWMPGKLSYQYRIMEDDKTISQCWTCSNLVNDTGKKVGVFPALLARMLYPRTISANMIACSYALVGQHSTQMYRREFAPELKHGEVTLDFWLAFSLALNGPAYYSKKILGNYRMTQSESVTRVKGDKRTTVDVLSRHLYDIIEAHPEHSAAAKSNLLVRRFFSRLRRHDTAEIDSIIAKTDDIQASAFWVITSFIYFAIQKLRL